MLFSRVYGKCQFRKASCETSDQTVESCKLLDAGQPCLAVFFGCAAGNTAMMDGGGNQGTKWTGNLFFDSDKPTTPSVKISGGANRKMVLASNLVATDPQFVVPETGADADFRLKGSSPAIGTTVAASASTTDVLGRTRDNRPDIGAYEFGAR